MGWQRLLLSGHSQPSLFCRELCPSFFFLETTFFVATFWSQRQGGTLCLPYAKELGTHHHAVLTAQDRTCSLEGDCWGGGRGLYLPLCHPQAASVYCHFRPSRKKNGAFCKSSQQESGLCAGLWNQVPCRILERYISACYAIFYLNKDHLLSWGQTNDWFPWQKSKCYFVLI